MLREHHDQDNGRCASAPLVTDEACSIYTRCKCNHLFPLRQSPVPLPRQTSTRRCPARRCQHAPRHCLSPGTKSEERALGLDGVAAATSAHVVGDLGHHRTALVVLDLATVRVDDDAAPAIRGRDAVT